MSIIINHDGGFFSCCSVKLETIINYINNNKRYPHKVDSSKLFMMYNPNKELDITHDFFEIPNNSEYITKNIGTRHNVLRNRVLRNRVLRHRVLRRNLYKNIEIDFKTCYQFDPYNKLDFINICPILNKYFKPCERIIKTIDSIIKKYDICYDNCIALYYRGTDKISETKIDSFESFYKKLYEIINIIKNENIKILIQTDTSQFLDYIKSKNINNLIIVEEIKSSYTDKGVHNEKTKLENYNDITYLLSTMLIISKCKYVICSSGNVSIFTIMYRGNSKNVYQNLNLNWV